jgi:hypothetical protein
MATPTAKSADAKAATVSYEAAAKPGYTDRVAVRSGS